MSDAPHALRHWRTFLKPDGVLAFDTPARPFGVSQRAAEVAARHGVYLAYGDIADTADKCRELLEDTAYQVLDVRTELANNAPMPLQDAIAFWDQRIDHPAWKPIKEAAPAERSVIRSDFIESVRSAASDGYVANDIALNFAHVRRLLAESSTARHSPACARWSYYRRCPERDHASAGCYVQNSKARREIYAFHQHGNDPLMNLITVIG